MADMDERAGQSLDAHEHNTPTDMDMTPVNRIQQNLLAVGERLVLNWLCARLPNWVKPDHLTAIGFFGAILTACGYVLSGQRVEWLWLSIVGYCVNWFGDSLDGSLARFRQIERPKFGYFLDHSTDSLANSLTAVGLGLGPFVRLDVSLFCLTGYLLLSIHTFLAARVVDEFRLSYLAAGPTEFRLILIAMTLAMLNFGPGPSVWEGFSAFDIFVVSIGFLLIALFVIQTLKTARQLSQ
jgi:archaetidylinositol phosphate synthase